MQSGVEFEDNFSTPTATFVWSREREREVEKKELTLSRSLFAGEFDSVFDVDAVARNNWNVCDGVRIKNKMEKNSLTFIPLHFCFACLLMQLMHMKKKTNRFLLHVFHFGYFFHFIFVHCLYLSIEKCFKIINKFI